MLLLLSIWLPIILLEVVLHYSRFEARRSHELQSNLEIARAVAASFDNFVTDLVRHEQALGNAALSIGRSEQIQVVLATNAAQHPALRDFFWTDPQGSVLVASSPWATNDTIGQSSYASLLEGGEWAVSDLQTDSDPAPVFVVARAIRASEGTVRGVLGAVVDPAQLSTILLFERASGGAIAVYDRRGQLAFSYPERETDGNDRVTAERSGLAEAMASGREVTGIFRVDADARDLLAAFVPIDPIGWTVEASRPAAEAMAGEVQDTINEAALYVIVGIIGTLFSILIGRRLTLPLRRLRSHALGIGRGELGRQIAIERPGELAELASAFNRMAKEVAVREGELQEHLGMLERAERELRAARDELEAKVQERTADLAGSEERLRSIVQTADSGVILVDRGGSIVFWNRGAENIFGYRPDEVLGQSIALIIPAGLRERHLAGFELAFSSGDARPESPTVEAVGVRKSGEEFPSELSLGSFVSRGASYVTGIVRDITLRKQAEAALSGHVERLRSTLERSVQAMALVVEMRDPYTAGHQRRVARLADAIARAMGQGDEQATVVRLASTVHDIGKIAVPSEILVKPGRISNWELDLIKVHPRIGFEILSTIDFPWPIAEIVHQHHERVDGSGYPNGLAGDDILFEARILAVADVVEAMASNRPYRPAIGIAEALAEITHSNARRYDPGVAAVCCQILADGTFCWE